MIRTQQTRVMTEGFWRAGSTEAPGWEGKLKASGCRQGFSWVVWAAWAQEASQFTAKSSMVQSAHSPARPSPLARPPESLEESALFKSTQVCNSECFAPNISLQGRFRMYPRGRDELTLKKPITHPTRYQVSIRKKRNTQTSGVS